VTKTVIKAQSQLDALGSAVRAARDARDLSQAELAAIVGVTRYTVINLERGHHAVSVGTLLLIANAIGLFDGTQAEGLLRAALMPSLGEPVHHAHSATKKARLPDAS